MCFKIMCFKLFALSYVLCVITLAPTAIFFVNFDLSIGVDIRVYAQTSFSLRNTKYLVVWQAVMT